NHIGGTSFYQAIYLSCSILVLVLFLLNSQKKSWTIDTIIPPCLSPSLACQQIIKVKMVELLPTK
ncbi:hypothetical protein ACHAXS_008270, partial [Conticribra weissflogii]